MLLESTAANLISFHQYKVKDKDKPVQYSTSSNICQRLVDQISELPSRNITTIEQLNYKIKASILLPLKNINKKENI